MDKIIYEFQREMEQAGLIVESVIADSKVHRCATRDKPRSRNGWYVFHPGPPSVGVFGDWAGIEKQTWIGRNGGSVADRVLLKKKIEEAEQDRREEEARRHKLARERALKILERCKPARVDHPYLAKKAVKPHGDIRSMKNLLVLPILDEAGAVTSLQFISPDGTKRFLSGGKIQGGYFPIKSAGGSLHICEGYATGATIHEATEETVLCALNDGNLESVARMARKKYPDREIIIAADNDHKTPGNPGLTKARQAAEAVGAKIVWPEFTEGATGTDFNDLKSACGLDEVEGQLTFPSDLVIACLWQNEDGDAYLLRKISRNKFCFDHRTERWFKFRGHFWAEDTRAEIFDQIAPVVDLYDEESQRQLGAANKARQAGDDKQVEYHMNLVSELGKRITRLQGKHRKESVIELSRNGVESLGISGTEWDSDPWVLPCDNGVIDLNSGEIRAGKPSDYIKTYAPTVYQGMDHRSAVWEQFMEQVFNGDHEMVDFMQTLLGGSLIGLSIEHFLAILVGKGRNGKDTMLEAIRATLGTGLASPIQSETLMSQSNVKSGSSHSADLVALKGRRLVWASESSEDRQLNAEKIKLFTGGGSLTGREPYARRPITFQPSHNIFLLTNFKPRANPDDYALWQRIYIISFPLSFVDEPAAENERKRDPHLLKKLYEECSGILAWLVRGCLKYQEKGKLMPPGQVRADVESYRAENDILAFWIDECCLHCGQEKSGKLYENYKNWCQANGHHSLSLTNFGKKMKGRFDSDRETGGVYYLGISLSGM